MKRIAMLIVFATLPVACADEADPPAPVATAPESPAVDVDERRVGIYGALIPELVGDQPEPCEDVLSEAEQQALRERLGDEDLRFIDDPTKLYDDDWFEGAPNEVVVTLGPIVERNGDVRVGASYLCGGLCGSGSTWVLEERDGSWKVVGTRGPSWIA